MEEKILEKYDDFDNHGSFSGLSGFLKNNKLKRSILKKVLQSSETYTHHRPVRYKFKRN